MKKITLALAIIFLSCIGTRSVAEDNLKVVIQNSYIRDSTNVELEIINNTSKNYYLQFDESKLNESILFFSSEYLHNIDFKLEDDNKQIVDYEIVDYQCYAPLNEEVYKVSKSVKNVFKIKSGEKKKMKMLFLMKKTVNDYCWYSYRKDLLKANHKYFVTFEYKMFNESDKNILSQAVKDSLKSQGYEFYEDQILSNKVPLYMGNSTN